MPVALSTRMNLILLRRSLATISWFLMTVMAGVQSRYGIIAPSRCTMSPFLDNLLAHVGLEDFGDSYAAVSLLVVLHDGDEDAGQG